MGWWRSWPTWLPFGPVTWKIQKLESELDKWLPQAELWRRGYDGLHVEEVCAGNDCGHKHDLSVEEIRCSIPTEMASAEKSDFAVGFHYQGSLHLRGGDLRPRVWGKKRREEETQSLKHTVRFSLPSTCVKWWRPWERALVNVSLSSSMTLVSCHLSTTDMHPGKGISIPQSSSAKRGQVCISCHRKRAVNVKTRCPRFRSSLCLENLDRVTNLSDF